ncbi:hypothetical protein BOTNAR_0089g00380 [Botryotinia narcissicola]|uniref:Uncharacterized protein n=1 Tax=Botryotinia narcissicola TaxID=278944 RepID=A0A4Z1IS67_9HELO|nr:hypothetical protein BOTNAR_0089g00380 [Botryotinia narcissicola]
MNLVKSHPSTEYAREKGTEEKERKASPGGLNKVLAMWKDLLGWGGVSPYLGLCYGLGRWYYRTGSEALES